MSTESNTALEDVSRVFPPLLWQHLPFPMVNGERTEASAGLMTEDSRRPKALLGVRVKLTKDSFEDFEEATW
jgi:hypothetical protein